MHFLSVTLSYMCEYSYKLHIMFTKFESLSIFEQLLLYTNMSRLHISKLNNKQMWCMSISMSEMFKFEQLFIMRKW